jgi:V8-like Glu-specific endopeptidase
VHCVHYKPVQVAAAFRAGPPAAKIAARLGSGYTSPVMPAVVRLYYDASPVATKGWCSGSILRPGVILTAAHCLFANHVDGEGQYGFFPANQLRIVPGNHPDASGQDVTEYGVWQVTRTYVPQGWQQDDGGLDWGIVVVAADSTGHYPGDYTGTYAARWDALLPVGTEFYNVGYPASGPFRTTQYFYGGGQYFCDTTWNPAYRSNDSTYTASSFNIDIYPCEMNGGASGGPVFAKLADGTWAIVGVNNRGSNQTNGFGYYGITMYMDDRFGEFWNSVINVIQANAASRGLDSARAVSSAAPGEPHTHAPN